MLEIRKTFDIGTICKRIPEMNNETEVSSLLESQERSVVFISVFRITFKIFILALIGLVALHWKRRQALGDLSKL